MIRFSERTIFSAALFIFTAVLLYKTTGMRADASLVPRIVGGFLLVFSGIQVLMDLFPAIERRLSFLNQKLTPGQPGIAGAEAALNDAAVTPGSTYLFFGWIAGYVLLIYFTSMMWATVIALFVYLKFINKESWTLSVLYCLGAATFIYFVFVVGFKLHYFL